MGRVFLEGVFSWSERFFFVSSFGILHLFEHDHSIDLLEVRFILYIYIYIIYIYIIYIYIIYIYIV